MSGLGAVVAHARYTGAEERRSLAERLRAVRPEGSLLLETCHRVELYASAEAIETLAAADVGPGRRLAGPDVPRHLVALAVGRSSVVLGEDQVLHQLRDAVAEARARGPLPGELDRLLDLALRAGRQARSWLPGRRPSLADAALEAALERAPDRPGPVLVVGAGRMGVLAVHAARRHGLEVRLASRTADRATRAAAELGVPASPFVPPASNLASVAGVVVALSGSWPLDREAADALVASGAWVADLSSPPATPPTVATRLADRFLSIDDLATQPSTVRGTPAIEDRLDRLIAATVAEHERWVADGPRRDAARALADRAEHARDAELEALFDRVKSLDPAEREAVARMADRLTARLLRDPLERLRTDGDGRHGRAARELFGL